MTDGYDFKFVQPDRSQAVVLERVEDTPAPEYCVHGQTKCFGCEKWLWLGSETFELVSAGKAVPVCILCASQNKSITPASRIGSLWDHR